MLAIWSGLFIPPLHVSTYLALSFFKGVFIYPFLLAGTFPNSVPINKSQDNLKPPVLLSSRVGRDNWEKTSLNPSSVSNRSPASPTLTLSPPFSWAVGSLMLLLFIPGQPCNARNTAGDGRRPVKLLNRFSSWWSST